MSNITQERLKELVYYNSETGIFTRIKRTSNSTKVGDIAGSINKCNGYSEFHLDSKKYSAHRLVWLYVYGRFPSHQIDHIDHNRSNNRLSNLREVTQSENNKNLSLRKLNKNGCTGIYWCNTYKKWHARINVDGKSIHIGYFANKDEAISSRKLANKKYFFHDNHGKLKPDQVAK